MIIHTVISATYELGFSRLLDNRVKEGWFIIGNMNTNITRNGSTHYSILLGFKDEKDNTTA